MRLLRSRAPVPTGGPGSDDHTRRWAAAAPAAAAPCVLCGERSRTFVMTGYDRMYARPVDYTYARCCGCGLVGLEPPPEAGHIATFYPDDYHARINGPPRRLDRPINQLAIRYLYGVDSVTQPWLLRTVFRALSGRILHGIREPYGRHRLLDIGCGHGGVLATYRQLGWTVAGVEIHAAAHRRCREQGLEVHLGTVFDAPFGPEFDVVLLSHVIEHTLQPIAVLRRAAEFLTSAGVLVVVTPNMAALGFAWYGSCWQPLDAPRHLYLFDRSTLERAARVAGLVPRTISTRAHPEGWRLSRRYARMQGRALPADFATRRALVERTALLAPRDRWFRKLIAPPASAIARVGRGDLLEGEFVRR